MGSSSSKVDNSAKTATGAGNVVTGGKKLKYQTSDLVIGKKAKVTINQTDNGAIERALGLADKALLANSQSKGFDAGELAAAFAKVPAPASAGPGIAFPPIDWQRLGLYAGGLIVLLLVVGFLWSKFK